MVNKNHNRTLLGPHAAVFRVIPDSGQEFGTPGAMHAAKALSSVAYTLFARTHPPPPTSLTVMEVCHCNGSNKNIPFLHFMDKEATVREQQQRNKSVGPCSGDAQPAHTCRLAVQTNGPVNISGRRM